MARFGFSKSKAREYAMLMSEIEEKFNFIFSNGAIRKGCKVEYVRVVDNSYCVIKGEVVHHSYGRDAGQHTFTIQDGEGKKYLVKGRNLYPRLLSHVQGEESLKCSTY